MPRFVVATDSGAEIQRFMNQQSVAIASTLKDREARAAIRKELRRAVSAARAASLSFNRSGYSGSVGTVLSARGTDYPVLRIGVRSRIARSFGGKQVLTRGRVRRGQALGMEYGNAKLSKREPLQKGFNDTRQRAVANLLAQQVTRVTEKRRNVANVVIRT